MKSTHKISSDNLYLKSLVDDLFDTWIMSGDSTPDSKYFLGLTDD